MWPKFFKFGFFSHEPAERKKGTILSLLFRMSRGKEALASSSVSFANVGLDEAELQQLCNELKSNTHVRRPYELFDQVTLIHALLISGRLCYTQVTALDLKSNSIRATGAVALAGMLAANTSLTSLSLEWAGLASAFDLLANGLCENKTLKKVMETSSWIPLSFAVARSLCDERIDEGLSIRGTQIENELSVFRLQTRA